MMVRAECNHQLPFGPSRYAVVEDDAPLPRSRRVVDATAITIPFQYRFAQIAELLLVLAAARVAGLAHAAG
jgi:hypothetical protein